MVEKDKDEVKNKRTLDFSELVKTGYIEEKGNECHEKGYIIFYKKEHYFDNIPPSGNTYDLNMTVDKAVKILDNIIADNQRKFKNMTGKVVLDINSADTRGCVFHPSDDYKETELYINIASLFPEYVEKKIDIASLPEEEQERLANMKISDLDFARLVHTAFHELRHVEQAEMTITGRFSRHRGVKMDAVRRMAQEQIVMEKNPGLYKFEYTHMLTEVDANRFGYEDGMKYLNSMFKDKDLCAITKNCMDRVAWEDLAIRYSYKEAKEGHLYSKNDFVNAYKSVGQDVSKGFGFFGQNYMAMDKMVKDQLRNFLESTKVGESLVKKLMEAGKEKQDPIPMLASLSIRIGDSKCLDAITSGALKNVDMSIQTMWGIGDEKFDEIIEDKGITEEVAKQCSMNVPSLDDILEQATRECSLDGNLDRDISKNAEFEIC